MRWLVGVLLSYFWLKIGFSLAAGARESDGFGAWVGVTLLVLAGLPVAVHTVNRALFGKTNACDACGGTGRARPKKDAEPTE